MSINRVSITRRETFVQSWTFVPQTLLKRCDDMLIDPHKYILINVGIFCILELYFLLVALNLLCV